MNIQSNVPLANYSTMGLGGAASHLVEVASRMDVLEALSWAQGKQLPAILIGGGSNIVWQDSGFPGLVMVNRIARYELFEEDETNTYLTVGGGEIWDSVVERTARAGLTGIEALSLIPGSAGAVPVQNVGAYGQEISQTLVSVEAFDVAAKDFVIVPVTDCGFGYRTSRFKTVDRGRFFITAITLHLLQGSPEPPYYPAVADYLSEHVINKPSPIELRDAVIAIRSSKLPDPRIIKNCGSFFANPIISSAEIAQIQSELDVQIPKWAVDDDTVKVSAAWLIEHAGFKDFHDPETGMAIWPLQPLVFINESAQSTANLLAFKQKIVDAVAQKFNITLIQEPELLPVLA
jgi:UDP-N-acetylmuramate dehydrogenase